MSTPKIEPRPRRSRLLPAVTLAWIVLYFAARVALHRLEMEPWLRVGIALVPVVPFIAVLWLIAVAVRGDMDELERRVHLEALALAFPLAMVLLMTLGLLQRAVPLPFEDWSYAHVWVYLPLFYFVGLAFAWRRYR
jgi:hypothetical protein